MIQIQKDFNKIPEGLQSKACIKKIKQALTDKNKHDFDAYHYRDSCIKDLQHLYHQKCAYCETNPLPGSSLQVEHFRPKKSVKDADNHHGYYWLAYEWSNLLLGCSKCNSYKSDHFPIAEDGVRVHEPIKKTDGSLDLDHLHPIAPYFVNEKALLLNPEVDAVEEHYIINSRGEWIPKQGSKKAAKTLDICQLNRIELKFARKRCIDDFVFRIEDHLKDLSDKLLDEPHFQLSMNKEFKNLLKKLNPKIPYSRTYWFMFNKFEKVVLPHIDTAADKKQVMKAFKIFQASIDMF
ncbi:MAG: hypothetical protein RL329_2091 [Bacteroidota bacterium]|jgi:uncharacterized protein (TIGR02646 family)